MRMYFAYTGNHFPYQYYLGVKSALKVNKKVTLLCTEFPTGEYFQKLKKEKNLEIKKVKVPVIPALRLEFYTPHTTKKMQENWRKVLVFDYVIWRAVCKNGGIIMGLDSETTKMWDHLLKDKEIFAPRFGGLDYKMHGVIVKKGSKLAEKIFKDIKTVASGKDIKGEHRAIINGKYRWGGCGIIPFLNNALSNYDKIATANISDKTKPFFASSNSDYDKITDPEKKTSRKFRFHLLGLVHLPTSEKYGSCAFTQKNVKMCKMLLNLGHEVFLYGSEGSDAPCTKLIQTHTLKDIREAWGDGDNRFEIGYDWKSTQFKHDINLKKTATTKKAILTAISKISINKKPDDFLLLTQGFYQKPISDALKMFLTIEPGIGYRGSFTKFRSFESTYIQYFTYGSEHPRKSINGKNYDRVIPNYFDVKEFPFVEKKEDYYLFMGRLINRKGLNIAIKTVEAIGGRLIVAGQKDPETKNLMKNPVIEYVGYADVKTRAKLMGGAKAIFTPSTYLEPFCGVHAEAMLCGTPVICTNFGAFTDYVIDGLNGYKCNTLQDFVDAAKNVEKLDTKSIRKYASIFTMDSIKLKYEKWFQELYRVYESTVDKNKKGWSHLKTSCKIKKTG